MEAHTGKMTLENESIVGRGERLRDIIAPNMVVLVGFLVLDQGACGRSKYH